MLSVHWPHLPESGWYAARKMDQRSRDILKAIAAGYSCEQILASDDSLTYHDIFHAVTEASTSHWRKTSARVEEGKLPKDVTSVRAPARHWRD